jgi:subtilisin-like proprotein convertase family protein
MQRTFTQKTSRLGILALALLCVFSLSANISFAQNDAKVPSQKLNSGQSKTMAAKLANVPKLTSDNTTSTNDAGVASKAPVTSGTSNLGPDAICATFTGALGTGDLTMSPRLFRGGTPPNGNCTTVFPFPGTSGTGPYYYDLHTYTNNTGLTQCGTFTLSTTDLTNANIQFAIYNGTFVPTNLATNYLADPDASSGTPATTLSLQVTVNAGQTLQIIVFSANVNTAASGTAANYTLTVDFPLCSSAPCTGTPTPGNTLTTASSVCSNISFTLSTQNATAGSGVGYQWQSSPTGAPGSFTNITGATSATYTTSATATTWYQSVVTCGAASGTSTPVQVTVTPCYCTAGATSTTFEKISNVTFGTINNNSTSTAGYENFTALSTNAYIGATMPISVSISGGFAADQVRVWIDYNKDFDFDDAGELVYTSANGVGPHIGNIIIPASVTPGTTRMRVRMFDTSLGPNSTPCGTSTYGQVEDYTLNLVPCIPVTVTTQPQNRSVACGSGTTFTVAVAGSVPAVYWQYRTSATGIWLNVPNTAPYSGVNTTTLTIAAVDGSMSGYQYRVVHSGVCSGADFSNPGTLTVTALPATVTPTSAAICLGSVQQLSLTNTVSAPTTVTFNATGMPVAIPDGTFPVGTATAIPITVSGIPAGSVIQNIGIRFSITHPYVGDLVMNLRAPNTQNLNMFALLDNSTGGNATANFTNTTIDSVSTTNISGAAAPRSGSYRAEKYAITNPNFGDLVVTNTAWSNLLSTMNGTWTIKVADLGAPDAGSVTAMSLFITYVAPNFAQGTWSGPAGTIFTDAAGTTAYTGTPATTVYVKPTALGVNNYTVNFVAGACQSTTATIPVTVRQLPSSVSAPVNKTICAGGNTFFKSTVTGGATSGLQWEVSLDNGATYAPVSGGVYTGTTSDSLVITGAPASYSGYRYRLVASAAPCAGNVTSAAATLTVNPLPVLVVSANPFTAIAPGQTTTLTVASNTTVPANGYQWYLNGVAIPGATSSTYVVDVDGLGTYSVTANDANGCGSAVAPTIQITSAPNDILFIYPSPNSGQFQIRYYSAPGNNPLPRFVNIYDSKGARVYSRSYSITQPYSRVDVDMSAYSTGIYHVELADKDGNRIKTGRVLIQK